MQLILKLPSSIPSKCLDLHQDVHYELAANAIHLFPQPVKETVINHLLNLALRNATIAHRNSTVLSQDLSYKSSAKSEHLDRFCAPLAKTLSDNSWTLLLEGKLINDDTQHIELSNALPFIQATVLPRLLGGKGGFGTLLRGKGARGPKTSNYESSRDLQGRRLRTARAPERMRQWVDKKIQEHEIIKAVGGEDPFIGKQLSAEEVVKLYKLHIPSDSHNPFEELPDPDQDIQAKIRLQAVQSAAQAITKNVQNHSLNATPESAESSFLLTHQQELDAYLDIGL